MKKLLYTLSYFSLGFSLMAQSITPPAIINEFEETIEVYQNKGGSSVFDTNWELKKETFRTIKEPHKEEFTKESLSEVAEYYIWDGASAYGLQDFPLKQNKYEAYREVAYYEEEPIEIKFFQTEQIDNAYNSYFGKFWEPFNENNPFSDLYFSTAILSVAVPGTNDSLSQMHSRAYYSRDTVIDPMELFMVKKTHKGLSPNYTYNTIQYYQNSIFDPYVIHLDSLDANGNAIKTRYISGSDSSVLAGENFTSRTFDEQGRLLAIYDSAKVIQEEFSYEDGSITHTEYLSGNPSHRNKSTYSDGNHVLEQYYRYQNNAWSYYQNWEYYYDEYGQMTKMINTDTENPSALPLTVALTDSSLISYMDVQGVYKIMRDSIVIKRKQTEEPLSSATHSNSKLTNVYPNPSSDIIYLQSENPIVSAQVRNTEGQIVLAKENTDQIDIQSLESGIYFIELKTKDRNTIHRIIKQ